MFDSTREQRPMFIEKISVSGNSPMEIFLVVRRTTISKNKVARHEKRSPRTTGRPLTSNPVRSVTIRCHGYQVGCMR